MIVESSKTEQSLNGADWRAQPDPEVVPKAKRRRFSAEYKLRILRAVDACSQPGEIGSLLRREGLYSSYLSKWRRQREAGQSAGLSPRKRGRKPAPEARRLAELERETECLRQPLEQAETIIAVQKKLARLLEQTEESEPRETG